MGRYVAVVCFTYKDSWLAMSKTEKENLSRQHISSFDALSQRVSTRHLVGTGFSKYHQINIHESDTLDSLNQMIDTYKQGAKARHAELREVFLMENGDVRKKSG